MTIARFQDFTNTEKLENNIAASDLSVSMDGYSGIFKLGIIPLVSKMSQCLCLDNLSHGKSLSEGPYTIFTG